MSSNSLGGLGRHQAMAMSGSGGSNTPLTSPFSPSMGLGGGAAISTPPHGSLGAGGRSSPRSHYFPANSFSEQPYGTTSNAISSSNAASASAANIAGMRIKKGKLLGKGAFGSVFQAMNTMSGELLAVKQLPIAHDVTAHTLRGIEREIAINSSLPPHPHCVRYLGVQSTLRNIYIVMEHVSGGSIQSLLQSVGQFHERTMRSYSTMVLYGLQHLHHNNVIHQDIKGANVLIDERGTAKIADFGCSKSTSAGGGGASSLGGGAGTDGASTTFHNAGTPLWMAPEVCRGEPATKSSDVWSFGCLLLEMVTAERSPWVFAPGTSAFAVLYAIGAAAKPPQPPAHLSPVARDFVSRCLILEASKRPTVDDLLHHPFITGKGVKDSGGPPSSPQAPLGVSYGGSSSPSTPAGAGGPPGGEAWASEWEDRPSSVGSQQQQQQQQRGPHHTRTNSDGVRSPTSDFAFHHHHASSPFLTRGPMGDTIGILPNRDGKALNLREIYLNNNNSNASGRHHGQHSFAEQGGRSSFYANGGNPTGASNPGARSAEFVLNAVDDDDDEGEGDGLASGRSSSGNAVPYHSHGYSGGRQHNNNTTHNSLNGGLQYGFGTATNSTQFRGNPVSHSDHPYQLQQVGVAENFGSDDEEDPPLSRSHSHGMPEHFGYRQHTDQFAGRGGDPGPADGLGDDDEDMQLMMAGEARIRDDEERRRRQQLSDSYVHHQPYGSPLGANSSPHQRHYYYQSGGSGTVPASPHGLGASTTTADNGSGASSSSYGGGGGGECDDGTVVWHTERSDVVDTSSHLFHAEEVGSDRHAKVTNIAETNKIASFFSKKFKCMNPLEDGNGKRRK